MVHLDTGVILAGGEALRLRPISSDKPKALVEINGKPLLEWIIEWLHYYNVTNIIIGVAYLKEQIMEYFGDGSQYGVDITYSIHTVEGGTSQGFRFAVKKYVDRENFFAMNGDQITDLNLLDMASFHLKHGKIATIAVNNPQCPFGQMILDEEQIVTDFIEKPICNFTFCNTGVYAFNRRILHFLQEQGSIEKQTFPILTRKQELKGYMYDGFFVTINAVKDIRIAENGLNKRWLKWGTW